jgi:hypothetical protein
MIFCFSNVYLAAQNYPTDSVIQEMEPIEKKSFDLGFHLSASINYLDYGSLGFLQISNDYGFGGSLGLSFDWEMANNFNIRFETFYEYQQFSDEYRDALNRFSAKFRNHGVGINLFPLILKTGNKFKPEVAFGTYIKHLLATKSEGTLNRVELEENFLTANTLQYGLVVGVGFYLNGKLIEARIQHSLVDYIEESISQNRLHQVKIVLNL